MPQYAMAADIAVGIQLTGDSIKIKDDQNIELAKMEGDAKFYPSLSLFTKPNYLFNDSQWGYQFKASATYFDISKQDVEGSESNLNTNIYGYSLSAAPVGFYHFNKNETDSWQFKVGIGIGVAYTKLKGDFVITNSDDADYGELKNVDTKQVSLASATYLEAKRGNHLIVLQAFVPTVSKESYQFEQSSITLSYSYLIPLY